MVLFHPLSQMAARQFQALDLAAAVVRSPWAGRLDDGVWLRSLSCSHESPAPWLTSEQNTRLAQPHAANGPPKETEAAIDARAGWKTIEVFVALLSAGWG